MLKKVSSLLLAAVMIIGIVPLNASAAEYGYEESSSSIVADGTYTATSTSSYKKDSETYKATVTVTVSDGKVAALTATGPTTSSDNKSYFNKALTGISSKLIGQTATSNVGDSVDAVSKATNSSKLIKEAIGIALSGAESGGSGGSETGGGSSGGSSSGADYVLVSQPKNGKKYIISEEDGKDDKNKDGYVLTGTGGTTELVIKAANSKQYNNPYITAADESNVFTFTGSISSFTLKNSSGKYLTFNGNNKAPTTSSSGTSFQYVDKKYFKYGSYYLVEKDHTFTLRNDKDDKIYFYEQVEAPATYYTVTWKNYDGSQTLKTDTNVASGTKPAYSGSTPTRAADEEFTYSFSGWSASPYQTSGVSAANLPAVSGNVTYYAAFAQTTRSYSVTWRNWDNSILRTDTLAYGTIPNYGGIPTKPANGSTTYTFNGWTPTLSRVTGSATYTATFTQNAPAISDGTYGDNSAAVEDFNYNPITAVTVKDGIIEEITADANTRARNLEYLAIALDGIKAQLLNQPVSAVDEIDAVSGATYASEALISEIKKGLSEEPKGPYTVQWQNYDGTVLENDTNVRYGSRTSYDNSTPVRSDGNNYTYSFRGWTPTVNVFVTEDITYTAEYDYELIPILPVADELYIDGTQTVERFGYIPVVSLKVEDGKFTSVEAAPGNASERNKYYLGIAVDWLRNGLIGKTANEASVDELDALTGATLSADALRAAAKNALSAEAAISWRNYDGTLLYSAKVTDGTLPPYDGEIPTREATAQYTYEFDGWTPEVTAVDGDKTYTAKFTETTNEYVVIFKNADGTVLQSGKAAYGTIPSYDGETPSKAATAEKTYTFGGWDKEISEVTEDAVYTATYKEADRKYTVTWKNDDGTVIDRTEAVYGEVPAHADPTKENDESYTYAFEGWTPTVKAVDGDTTYTAVYKKTSTLKNNSTVKSETIALGEKITLNGAAEGGEGTYTYAYYYKRPTSSKWTAIGTEFGTSATAAIKPSSTGDLEVKVTVKDSAGTKSEKVFKVTISDPVPTLVNDSKINAESVTVGTKVIITGAASGGTGTYTYAYYYKRPTSSKWTAIGTEFGTATTATVKPSSSGELEIKVIVKDSSGTKTEKTFKITISEPLAALVNESEINADSVTVGTKVIIAGAASGGTGTYTYAYYYKRPTSSKWTAIGTEFGTATTAAVKPSSSGELEIKVIVKDSSGTKTEKTFKVTISSLANESEISAESITLGTKVTVTGAASGGTGTYTYAYYYKRPTSSKWTVIGTEFGTATTATIKPSSAGELEIKAVVKDSETGDTIAKQFTVKISG